jgi:hypothetical protein
MICSNGAGVTASCPTNGRSCAAISNTEADTPVANSPMAISDESRSSQCTIAIASKAQIACRYRPGARLAVFHANVCCCAFKTPSMPSGDRR